MPKKKTAPDAPLFAFWRYGSAPYFLGGRVTAFREDGMVQTVEYGAGNWFQPVLILPLESGKERMALLKRMEHDHAAAIKALNNDLSKRVGRLMGVRP